MCVQPNSLGYSFLPCLSDFHRQVIGKSVLWADSLSINHVGINSNFQNKQYSRPD